MTMIPFMVACVFPLLGGNPFSCAWISAGGVAWHRTHLRLSSPGELGDDDAVDVLRQSLMGNFETDSDTKNNNSISIRSAVDLRNEVLKQAQAKSPQPRRKKRYAHGAASNDPLTDSISPTNQLDISELEAVVQEIWQLYPDTTNLTSSLDSVFLDGDAYLKYSSTEEVQRAKGYDGNSDGLEAARPNSLFEKELIQFTQPPDAPYGTTGNNEATFEDILAVHRAASHRAPPSQEEEKRIFDEVFKNEESYLDQTSEIFREGLTNKTAAEEATKIRRGRAYQEKLLKEIEKLESAITEFEGFLSSEAEMDRGKKEPMTDFGTDSTKDTQKNAPPHVSPLSIQGEEADQWVEVDDPSTLDVFYWNSATGEMISYEERWSE